jgi:hypothetical protein
MTDVYGWHFVAADRHLGYEDGRPVAVGETLTVRGPLVMCKQGLHASPRATDALGYAPGPVACYVRLSGEVLEPTAEHPDKMCATERTVLAMVDATPILPDFIRDTLVYRQPHLVPLFEAAGLHGHAKTIGDADLRPMGWSEMALLFTAARDAAMDNPGSSAWYAARYASRDAWAGWDASRAAWDAARGAWGPVGSGMAAEGAAHAGAVARAAAWAARAAAEVAAWAAWAAWHAAWDAAWYAARAAARDDLNAMLEARLKEAMGL